MSYPGMGCTLREFCLSCDQRVRIRENVNTKLWEIGKMKVEIRRAKIFDVPAIVRIEDETSDTPWSAKAITDDVTKNDRAYVAVALVFSDSEDVSEDVNKDDNAVAAGAMAGSSERAGYADMWIVAGEAQLNNIGVYERFRRQGIGEKLLTHMIDVAAERDCDVMTLEVRAGNSAAIALYSKLGFKQVGIRRNYYRNNGEDAILMNKAISAIDVEYSTGIEIEFNSGTCENANDISQNDNIGSNDVATDNDTSNNDESNMTEKTVSFDIEL